MLKTWGSNPSKTEGQIMQNKNWNHRENQISVTFNKNLKIKTNVTNQIWTEKRNNMRKQNFRARWCPIHALIMCLLLCLFLLVFLCVVYSPFVSSVRFLIFFIFFFLAFHFLWSCSFLHLIVLVFSVYFLYLSSLCFLLFAIVSLFFYIL